MRKAGTGARGAQEQEAQGREGHRGERMPASDPKNLIRECYRIEGISDAECRSVFLDWLLSLPDGQDPAALIPELLARHGDTAPPDHPMTRLLREGAGEWKGTRRRGRRRKGRRNAGKRRGADG